MCLKWNCASIPHGTIPHNLIFQFSFTFHKKQKKKKIQIKAIVGLTTKLVMKYIIDIDSGSRLYQYVAAGQWPNETIIKVNDKGIGVLFWTRINMYANKNNTLA